MKILVWDNCPACDKLKHYIEENDINIDMIHENKREGRDAIRDYRIMWKPALIDWDTFYTWEAIYDKLKKWA